MWEKIYGIVILSVFFASFFLACFQLGRTTQPPPETKPDEPQDRKTPT